MNLTHFHHTCMAGGNIYNSSRILHALLKKSYKTGGCLLKLSDQDHRIQNTSGWVGGVSCCPNPLKKLNIPRRRRSAIPWLAAAQTGIIGVLLAGRGNGSCTACWAPSASAAMASIETERLVKAFYFVFKTYIIGLLLNLR